MTALPGSYCIVDSTWNIFPILNHFTSCLHVEHLRPRPPTPAHFPSPSRGLAAMSWFLSKSDFSRRSFTLLCELAEAVPSLVPRTSRNTLPVVKRQRQPPLAGSAWERRSECPGIVHSTGRLRGPLSGTTEARQRRVPCPCSSTG